MIGNGDALFSLIDYEDIDSKKINLITALIATRDLYIEKNKEQIEDKKESVEQFNWKAKLADQENTLLAQEAEIEDLDRQIGELTKEQ